VLSAVQQDAIRVAAFWLGVGNRIITSYLSLRLVVESGFIEQSVLLDKATGGGCIIALKPRLWRRLALNGVSFTVVTKP